MAQKIKSPREALLDHARFSAVITPHRSLSARGFIILMSTISLISFTAGVVFFSMGLWPVPGFLGLDVLLIYLAFKFNYRSGRAFETVNMTDKELTLTRVDPDGKPQIWTFNPYWVKLGLDESHDGRADLYFLSHGRKLFFGADLTPREKKEFMRAMNEALVRYRARLPEMPPGQV